jgi:CRP/FNR family cyclic AMP-dependent transcriptional regulator
MNEERLKKVPLFGSLPKKELKKLAQHADEVQVAAGTRLATQGDFAYEFFVIEDGTAEITQDGKRLDADLGPGDFFGEIGLLESERRTATVTATSPMTLVVMTGWDFRALERELPQVSAEVRAAIKERMRR